MKKTSDNSSHRRKFLSLGLLGGAALITQKATAMIPTEPEEETIPMLTPEGKLVQVSKRVLQSTQEKQKAGNQEILNWMTTQNKTRP
jgi:hypothetical protein